MNVLYALAALAVLLMVPIVGIGAVKATFLFGVILPYAAFSAFVLGVIYKVVQWARSPVPFRVPTTCGQGKSLPWIRSSRLDNPHDTLGVLGRMALEVLAFRSLFRNTESEHVKGGQRVLYGASKFLWAGALAFHYAFLVILIRHLRLFMEPVPRAVTIVQNLDGFFQIMLPAIYATDGIILAALGYLLLRRLLDAKLRYLSLPADYFALFLLLGIMISGVWMRYVVKTDTVGMKELALGLLSFRPAVPEGIGTAFFVHLFLVSCLLAYFPVSKLMHMAGIFMSPTRNLANNNRMKRHINPWNAPVKVHTYKEWEEEFHDKIKAAGLPMEGK